MYSTIQACRICGNKNLESIVDLGNMALTGRFPLPHEKIPVGPLELVRCASHGNNDACGLVQLRQSYDLGELFTDHYGYRSSLNRSMVRHLETIVKRAQELVTLDPDDLVLDIGSNDGTTLGLYQRLDLDLVGIDACGHKFAQYYPGHVRLIADFFSAAKVREIVGPKKARIITSIAMFYDLENPLAFVREIHDILAKDGIWIFEQSYLPMMIDNTSYDTICHEHLEYYALRQIVWMFDRANMKIVDVRSST
jgi:NDP-4-keto-2,6-dideoxyhexose 3-C-methyltransferase